MQVLRRQSLRLLIVLAVLASPADAAAIDCRRAASAAEKTICRDPDALAADAAMAAAYHSALQKLSQPNAALLRASQRGFPAYLATSCSLDRPNTDGKDWESRPVGQCLRERMEERTAKLAAPGINIGSRRFIAIETLDAWLPPGGWPADSGAADDPRPAVDSTVLLQIEPATTPAERAWNAAMVKAVGAGLASARGNLEAPVPVHDPDNPQDSSARLDIVSASPSLIVSDIEIGWYGLGRPHGNGATETTVWSLALGRALVPEDLFRPGWQAAIGAMVLKQLVADGAIQSDAGFAPSARQVMRLTKRGVCVRFDPYEFGGYGSPGPLLLTWQTLQPTLKSQSFFEPAALQDAPDSC
jgi:uncharacterized protein YecT (DUF1311 family)